MLKRLLSTLLLVAVLLQMCSTIAVVVSFKINQDYIATYLCVNRDKPTLHCNGKCVLMQRMQDQIDDRQDQNRRNVQQLMGHEVVLFFQELSFPSLSDNNFNLRKALTINSFYTSKKSQQSLDCLFHPPSANVQATLVA